MRIYCLKTGSTFITLFFSILIKDFCVLQIICSSIHFPVSQHFWNRVVWRSVWRHMSVPLFARRGRQSFIVSVSVLHVKSRLSGSSTFLAIWNAGIPLVLIYKLNLYCFISLPFAGRVGLWKDVFTVSMNDKFDAVYRQKMGKSDLTFDFGLWGESSSLRHLPTLHSTDLLQYRWHTLPHQVVHLYQSDMGLHDKYFVNSNQRLWTGKKKDVKIY